MIVMPFLGIASIWDLKTRRIPNTLIAGGLVCAYISAALVSIDVFGWAVAGTVVGMVVMLPFYNWNLMGGGDVKLAGLVGAMVSFPHILIALLMTMTIAAIVIPVLQALGAVKRGDRVPFAPILTLGAVGAYFWAGDLINVYGGIFVSG